MLIHSGEENRWFQPLALVKEFLQLTDSQLEAILTNNDEYNRWSWEKQNRIQQVQNEIGDETSKDTLDPTALGIRYAEIESICRNMKDQAARFQKKNVEMLNDTQRAELKGLEGCHEVDTGGR